MFIRFLFILLSVNLVFGQSLEKKSKIKIPLTSSKGLELVNVIAEKIEHDGKEGLKIVKSSKEVKTGTLVVIEDVTFKNGIIELELTGEPAPDADPQMRGFVGLAFRLDPDDYSNYECIYLRPTNARAENQIRRNHSTQYISHPEFPWYRLRKEFPKMYESYVDLAPGKWTKVKIEVSGISAKLFVNNGEQPCLIVNDLKHGEREGKIALWLHSSTLARYRNLEIRN